MNDYVTKSDFNEFKKEIKEEFRIHTGILIEEFQKRINFVIDGQEVLTQRVDKIDSRLTKVETKVDKIDSRLTKVETNIDKMDSKLTKVEDKVDNIHTELTSHRNSTELHTPIVKQKGKKQA